MAYIIENYTDNIEDKWDEFILKRSINGLFIQTRKFINYHEQDKFKDCSLIVKKGDEIVSAILACEIEEGSKRVFYAHKGSTFGGISISSNIYSVEALDEILDLILNKVKDMGFDKIYLKMVPEVYQRSSSELLDYYLYNKGFQCFDELNFYMHLDRYVDNIENQFSSKKRRDYRYSLKNGLTFKKLENKDEIFDYHEILKMNLKKLNLPLIHSLSDFYDLKYNRFSENMDFYGVFYEGRMIAGSLLFYFNDNIVHTQYLSSNEEYLKLFPMDFLIYNLIKVAIERKADLFTFGICTEDEGRYLNMGLSKFKEGFGAEYCINRTYTKDL